MNADAARAFEEKCRQASCRSCGGRGLLAVLDLGAMPLADGLLTRPADPDERRYPLEVAFCAACGLVQILQTVPPEVLFGADYPYYSSFSDALLAHSRDNALELIAARRLHAASCVVEVASNDGYLLRNFHEVGIPVLGIDPAPGPAAAARAIGVPTIEAFFGRDLARCLRAQGRAADVILANNVLAHVADTNGFVAGLATLLKDDGVVVIEAPYVRDLVDHCQFDTIYHEHLCYFSLTAATALFARHGLTCHDVRRLGIHGGSLRYYLGKGGTPGEAARRLLAEERDIGLDGPGYYQDFARRVSAVREALRDMLASLKAQGRRIAAYGAAAKGAVLLNAIPAGAETIDFVVDRNVHKQGKYMPGVHIPIHEPGRILADMPDYVLLLPWNFQEEILRQNEPYRRAGGKFIVPIPTPRIV